MIDALVMVLVIFLLQLPVFYLVYLRDQEIARLNKALLRVEKPTAAAIAEAKPRPEKTQEERAREKELIKERQALWGR